MDDYQHLQDQALAWIKQKWRTQKCPVCGVDDWGVAEPVGLRPYPEPIFGGGGVIPLVPIICKNCGYTRMLNGVVSGLFPPRET